MNSNNEFEDKATGLQLLKKYYKDGVKKEIITLNSAESFVPSSSQSSGIITFSRTINLMRIDSVNAGDCKLIVDGLSPTYLSLTDGRTSLNNATYLNREIIFELYSEVNRIANDEKSSIQIEYVMDNENNIFYLLQLKHLEFSKGASYIHPKYLEKLENEYQEIEEVDTIVIGDNAVIETDSVFWFKDIKQAHDRFMKNPKKKDLYIIEDMSQHSMASEYASNFQSAGITVLLVPNSENIVLSTKEEKKVLICSPQQKKLFILTNKEYKKFKAELTDMTYIEAGNFYYPIPSNQQFVVDKALLSNDTLLKNSISYAIEKQIEKHKDQNNFILNDPKSIRPSDVYNQKISNLDLKKNKIPPDPNEEKQALTEYKQDEENKKNQINESDLKNKTNSSSLESKNHAKTDSPSVTKAPTIENKASKQAIINLLDLCINYSNHLENTVRKKYSKSKYPDIFQINSSELLIRKYKAIDELMTTLRQENINNQEKLSAFKIKFNIHQPLIRHRRDGPARIFLKRVLDIITLRLAHSWFWNVKGRQFANQIDKVIKDNNPQPKP